MESLKLTAHAQRFSVQLLTISRHKQEPYLTTKNKYIYKKVDRVFFCREFVSSDFKHDIKM